MALALLPQAWWDQSFIGPTGSSGTAMRQGVGQQEEGWRANGRECCNRAPAVRPQPERLPVLDQAAPGAWTGRSNNFLQRHAF
ncbi:hypothetical protein [Geminicoccus roseus]|uniref:hypothetical protein n=1 Tax=Geminicoccus roseus TaxID=404900 RepID=UPI0012FBB1D5|nr:hypothetical protein [Geminicoccus roseus]